MTFGDSVQLADIVIPTDARSRVLIDYAGPEGTIPHVPAVDMLQGKALERIKDRAVFIGATAPGLYDLRVTPFSPTMPGVEKHANMAANILDRRFIVRPVWGEFVEGASIVLFPLLLALIVPAMRPYRSIAMTVAIWVGAVRGQPTTRFVGACGSTSSTPRWRCCSPSSRSRSIASCSRSGSGSTPGALSSST